jgi:hypothetical protein
VEEVFFGEASKGRTSLGLVAVSISRGGGGRLVISLSSFFCSCSSRLSLTDPFELFPERSVFSSVFPSSLASSRKSSPATLTSVPFLSSFCSSPILISSLTETTDLESSRTLFLFTCLCPKIPFSINFSLCSLISSRSYNSFKLFTVVNIFTSLRINSTCSANFT